MATRKYIIVGDNDQAIGHIILKEPTQPPTFQHTTKSVLPDGGPMADSILLITALGGFTSVAWLAFGPGWVAPMVGLTITAVLATIKAWRGSILPEPGEDKKPETEPQRPIRLEAISQDNSHWLIGELDQAITMADLLSVATALTGPKARWSRPYLVKQSSLSQGKYRLLTDGLVQFGYLQPLPNDANGVELTPRGRALFRQLSAR